MLTLKYHLETKTETGLHTKCSKPVRKYMFPYLLSCQKLKSKPSVHLLLQVKDEKDLFEPSSADCETDSVSV